MLTENFPPMSGGSGRWFWELYSRLPKNDYLIVADEGTEANDFDKTHDLNVIRMPLKSNEWGLRSLTGLKFYFNSYRRLRRVIKEHGITHIHTGRVIHEGVIAWLLSLSLGVKFLTYVHGEDVETAAMSREYNFLVKLVCSKAEMIICNSENSRTIVERLGYASGDKIVVLNPGVDSTKFIPSKVDERFRQQLGWHNKKVIITVGRLQQRKGQDKMIAAMPDILTHHPDALYAVIGRGECAGLLKGLIEKHGLQNSVQLLDEVSDEQMIKCYQQCDLFILPNRTIESDIEGFGMVLVEAQSCAKPVVAGDSGGTRETMLVGQSGFIIDCTSSENIAKELSKILDDEDFMDSMGKVGRQHVENTLDWLAHTEKAKQLFLKI
ncbi:glycosyltransferase family 4 protein [Endozoicomonas sp. G2_1]|uniref:glycosyltransferase family 4 protein n=1 Tax=Endozoicomonas sp. G2_1 TaxID=2821091 RepID=UPI0032AEB1C1